jgi:hypothetical protein
VHRDALGRLDANPDLIAFDAQDGDVDVIANLQGLANSSSEDQHRPSPCFGTPNVLRRSSQWNPLSWFFLTAKAWREQVTQLMRRYVQKALELGYALRPAGAESDGGKYDRWESSVIGPDN